MALVRCRECGNKVSDQAPACPKCGNPNPAMPEYTQPIDKRKRNRQALILAGIVVGLLSLRWLGALVSPPPPEAVAATPAPAASVRSQEEQDANWIYEMERRMRAQLRDPDSAEFRGSFVSRKSGAPIVCGEVNSKNGFGGLTGYQRFISAGQIQAVEDQIADGGMDELWGQLCR